MADFTPLPADFGARLRSARAYRGVDRIQFGKELGVSATTIKNWEANRRPGEMAVPELVRRLTKASRLPEWFFTVPRLESAVRTLPQNPDERLARIEEKLERLLQPTPDSPIIAGLSRALGLAEGQREEASAQTPQRSARGHGRKAADPRHAA